MTLPPALELLRRDHADRLILFGLLLAGGAAALLQFARLFPHAGPGLFGLPPRFWLVVTLLYGLAMVAENFWTGIPHYAGWKKLLALVDLALLGILIHVTGGPRSALAPLYYLQVVLMAIFAEVDLEALDGHPSPRRRRGALAGALWWIESFLPLYYVWYLPALAATWLLPQGAGWGTGRPGVELLLRFGGLAGVGFVIRNLARIWRERTVAEMANARDAEERMHFAQYQTELARKEAELAHEGLHQREVTNWINLTAGLTHSIGNEVLAFHHYSQEILEYLEQAENVPPQIEESMEFIHDTNRARLGFINFLQEFAEMMKLSADVRQVPAGLGPIDLHKLVHAVREKVGRFESRELDPNEPDKQIQRQLKKNLELGLVIHFEDQRARTISMGRRPVLEFICYEFIKNSLRNCSGQRRLKVIVSRRDDDVQIRFLNDLDIEIREPTTGGGGHFCSACRTPAGALYWLKNSDFLDAFCEACLRGKVEQNLEQCWTPGKTSQGGKGLGLFVIRHFIDQYYFGRTSAHIFNWETREVCFELVVPDRLDLSIEGHNREMEARRKARSGS